MAVNSLIIQSFLLLAIFGLTYSAVTINRLSLVKADEDAFTCYVCDGTDVSCKNQQTEGGFQCSESETECATLIDSNGLTVRKCGLDCTEAGCDKCTTADCNSAVFPNDRRQCYQCDSTSSGCTTSQLATSQFTPCLKYTADDNCYTVIEGDVLYRGCESDEENKCTGNDKCVKCDNESGCNNIVGSVDVTCKSCSNCGTNTQTDKTCTKDFGITDSCAYSLTDGVVFKGCASECEDCTKCNEANCNNQLYCITCDSTTDLTCVTNPATTTSTLCAEGSTCITATGTTGNTIRGCSNVVTEENSATCSTDQCNKDVYPANRLSCYKCSGPTCISSALDALTPEVCSKYSATDKCYTLVKDNVISRGCLSDVTDDSCTGNDCVTCDEAGGCNDVVGTYTEQCKACADCGGDTPALSTSCVVDFGTANTCYNSISATFEITKGCAKECTEAACNYCLGSDCNDELYCLECDSANDNSCVTGTGNPKTTACTKGQKCLSGINTAGNVVRGCENDITAEPQTLCATDKCNTGLYPADQLSCYQCSGAGCIQSALEALLPTLCSKFSATDKCYTLVKDNVISRGCLSDVTDDSCTGNNNCVTCDGAGCNDVVGTYNVQCKVCTDCGGDTPASSTSCPIDFGTANTCYNSISTTFEVSKGCAKECTGTQCTYCQGDDCNDQLYCLKCASTVDSVCIPGTEDPATTPCGKGLQCLTGIDATGNTIRGCENGITVSPQALCSTDKCNTGLYPTNRLSCYQCSGVECISESLLPAGHGFCSLYKENDECYLIVSEDGETVTRGCVSNEVTCTDNEHCISCSGSACNNQVEQQYCIQCSGNDCLTGLTTGTVCPSGASLSYEQCYTYNNKETVVRGCISSAEENIKAICNDDEDDQCTLCSGASCNNAVENLYASCIVCDSTTGNCDENLNTLASDCADADAKCFLYRKDATGDEPEIVQRGCVDNNTPAECSVTASDTCKTCEGRNCNEKVEFQTCHVCDDCELIPTGAQTVCEEYMAQCSVYIDTVTFKTVRACTSADDVLPEGTLISKCEENGCNNKIFPEDRILCHQCDTDVATCQTIAAQTIGLPCNLYKDDEVCYSYLDNELMVRGCTSDANSEKCILTGTETNCKDCSTDNCNTDLVSNPPTLKCIKCEESDEACAWGYNESEGTLCKSTLPFLSPKTESCYTTNVDSKVSRGCLLDDDATVCDATNSCEKCTAEGCNNINIEKFQCVQCNSGVAGEESCAKVGSEINIAATDCEGTMEYEKRGCYRIENENIIRGCNSDLQPTLYDTCSANSDSACLLCNNEPGCNGAAALSVLSGTMLLVVAYLIKLLF